MPSLLLSLPVAAVAAAAAGGLPTHDSGDQPVSANGCIKYQRLRMEDRQESRASMLVAIISITFAERLWLEGKPLTQLAHRSNEELVFGLTRLQCGPMIFESIPTGNTYDYLMYLPHVDEQLQHPLKLQLTSQHLLPTTRNTFGSLLLLHHNDVEFLSGCVMSFLPPNQQFFQPIKYLTTSTGKLVDVDVPLQMCDNQLGMLTLLPHMHVLTSNAGVAAHSMSITKLEAITHFLHHSSTFQAVRHQSLGNQSARGKSLDGNCSVVSKVVETIIMLQTSETDQVDEEQELDEQVSSTLRAERNFKDISQALSTNACSQRMHHDVADKLALDISESIQTEFAGTLIKAIAMPIILAICAPMILELCLNILIPIRDELEPRVIDGVEGPLFLTLEPLIQLGLGDVLGEKLDASLPDAVGNMLVKSFAFHIPRVLGREIPPQLSQFLLRFESPKIAKEIAHKLVHKLTHALTRSLSTEVQHHVVDGVTHALTHSLIHYYYCIYCYNMGDYCHWCYSYNDFHRLGSQMGGMGKYAKTESDM